MKGKIRPRNECYRCLHCTLPYLVVGAGYRIVIPALFRHALLYPFRPASSLRTSSPSSSSTPDQLIDRRICHFHHLHRASCCPDSILPAAVALADSAFAVVALADRTGLAGDRTGPDLVRMGWASCRSSLSWRTAGRADCRSRARAGRMPGLAQGNRRARDRRRELGAGTAGMREVRQRARRISEMPSRRSDARFERSGRTVARCFLRRRVCEDVPVITRGEG